MIGIWRQVWSDHAISSPSSKNPMIHPILSGVQLAFAYVASMGMFYFLYACAAQRT